MGREGLFSNMCHVSECYTSQFSILSLHSLACTMYVHYVYTWGLMYTYHMPHIYVALHVHTIFMYLFKCPQHLLFSAKTLTDITNNTLPDTLMPKGEMHVLILA